MCAQRAADVQERHRPGQSMLFRSTGSEWSTVPPNRISARADVAAIGTDRDGATMGYRRPILSDRSLGTVAFSHLHLIHLLTSSVLDYTWPLARPVSLPFRALKIMPSLTRFF